MAAPHVNAYCMPWTTALMHRAEADAVPNPAMILNGVRLMRMRHGGDSSLTSSSTIIVEDQRGSALTARIERVWHMLRDLHAAIPPAVITLYALPTRRPRQNNGVLFGHFSPAVWLPGPNGQGHEVGVNPTLFGNAKDVLGSLLHEAAHAVLQNDANNGKTHNAGCALHDSFYHRTEFRDLCQRWGLECRFRNRRYGFCDSRWPNDQPPRQYGPVLRYIERNIPAGVRPSARPDKNRQTHLLPLRCKCADPNRVCYVRRVAENQCGIRCDHCGALFKLPKDLFSLAN